jgi:hypothetical protein
MPKGSNASTTQDKRKHKLRHNSHEHTTAKWPKAIGRIARGPFCLRGNSTAVEELRKAMSDENVQQETMDTTAP